MNVWEISGKKQVCLYVYFAVCFVLNLTSFSAYKMCFVSDWRYQRKPCERGEFYSVCLEVRGIRLVQDKGIMSAL